MKKDICIMIPNESLVNQVQRVLSLHNIDIPVYLSSVHTDESVFQANEHIRQGTKVIICRGRIVSLLRENLDIPVVEIRYSFDEFVSATMEALEYTKRIALVGYNENFNATLLREVFDFDQLDFRVISSPAQTDEIMAELKTQGFQAVVSGQRIGMIAKKHGMMTFPVHISTSNLLYAIREARHLRRLEFEKQHQFEGIATLLDHTQEGIISIDGNGIILSSNRVAENLMQIQIAEEKVSVYRFVPDHIILQILDGTPAYNEVVPIRSEPMLLSGIATRLSDSQMGAILTIQPASDVHQKEYALRRKARAKGRIARHTFSHIIGHSEALEETKKEAALFAATDSSILITGETGTGKELFAQSIHNASRRSEKPFVAINCASLPESVLESELFGYVKGAFTGALPEGKSGIFEQAHTGTIFLDEISEISPNMQARLLRVIQEREITRVGDDKIIPIDVRLITSTNRDLRDDILSGRFREDLFYRINVLTLRLPPLADRQADIADLSRYFASVFSKNMNRHVVFSEPALDRMRQLPWPGNIRQLRNFVECAVALCDSEEIKESLIETVLRISGQPEHIRGSVPHECFVRVRKDTDEEQTRIIRVLEACDGNKTKAAKELGIAYSTLWRKLRKIDARLIPDSAQP